MSYSSFVGSAIWVTLLLILSDSIFLPPLTVDNLENAVLYLAGLGFIVLGVFVVRIFISIVVGGGLAGYAVHRMLNKPQDITRRIHENLETITSHTLVE